MKNTILYSLFLILIVFRNLANMYFQSKIIVSQNKALDDSEIIELCSLDNKELSILKILKEEDEKSIGVKNLGHLFYWNNLKDNKTKLCIIYRAEHLTPEAQNSILKVIEEPNPNTQFVLITNNEFKLLETIRSRCQIISLKDFQDSEDKLNFGKYLMSNILEREKINEEILKSKNSREILDEFIEYLLENNNWKGHNVNHKSKLALLIKSKKANRQNVSIKAILDNLNINL